MHKSEGHDRLYDKGQCKQAVPPAGGTALFLTPAYPFLGHRRLSQSVPTYAASVLVLLNSMQVVMPCSHPRPALLRHPLPSHLVGSRATCNPTLAPSIGYM